MSPETFGGDSEALDAAVQPLPDEVSSTPAETTAEPGDAPAETPPAKNGVQKRIDELTREKMTAREEAAYWRGIAERTQTPAEPPKQEPAKRPAFDDYGNVEDYVDAVAEYRAREVAAATLKEQSEASQRQQREHAERNQQEQFNQAVRAQVNAGREKYADFDDVVTKLTGAPQTMFVGMAAAENGSDVAYHLGQNIAEAQKIAAMNPAQQLVAIGQLAARLSQTTRAPTNAPPPPTTLRGTGGGARDPSALSMDEYAAQHWSRRKGS